MMSHERMREILSLSIYDEVNEEERFLLEEHLTGCEPCKKELQNLKKLHVVLGSPALVAEELLQQARTQLREALRSERNKQSFLQKISQRFPLFVPRYAPAWSAAFALVLGLLIGRYSFFHPAQIAPKVPKTPETIEEVAYNDARNLFERGNVEINDVKFTDSDASDGQVEFTFNAVAPMHYKGSINDPKVQDVLTHAIVSADNPGTRLAAVNTLDKYAPRDPDPEIKQALIKAARKDSNPAVRQQALTVLENFRFDQEIKETFLYVLLQDKNPGLRIEAIKGLEGKQLDQQDLNVMRKAATDDNNYIRLRANHVLREVKQ